MPKLFSANSQIREELSIWKLIHHPVFWDFAGGYPVKWVAINIPMNIFGKNNYRGEIDLLLSLACPPIPSSHPDYIRAFEIKTSVVNSTGLIKSFTGKKFRHGIKQCKKLENFGAEMIWFIDLFVFEHGVSIPDEAHQKIDQELQLRAQQFSSLNFGYNAKILHYHFKEDEYSSGMMYPSRDYVYGKHLTAKEPFIQLTNTLDYIANKFRSDSGIPVVYLCGHCKGVVVASHTDRSPICKVCHAELLIHQ